MNKKKKTLRISGYILIGFFCFLASVIFSACIWTKEVFSVEFEEIIFILKSPLKGTESGIILDALKNCIPIILKTVLIFLILVFIDIKLKVIIKLKIKLFKLHFTLNVRSTARRIISLLSAISLILSLVYADSQYSIVKYIKGRLNQSTIYEDYYIHPDSVNIRADGDEKNLIYIFIESLENTYASVEDGGSQQTSYIPELTTLANDNISFSHSEQLGGMYTTHGTTCTMFSLLSMTSGVPFKFPANGRTMSVREKFASGLTTIGDILNSFGYNQIFLCGSDGDYAGRKDYFEQHGSYEVVDLYKSRKKGYVPDDYFVWWGFEDMHLFDIAKKEIELAYAKGTPFNATILTVDTHPMGGYVCSMCDNKHDIPTANVVACTDKQVSDFVNWCKQQPFYEDTVIILCGDHLRLDTYLIENIPYEERTVYNCFLNCEYKNAVKTTNRIFTHMDMFPTTLSAMGFEFDGNRIGLGTDLFSNEPTLAEKLGFEYFNDELSKYSKYYIDNFS